MMYDLLDSERQYRTFLDNMKLIQVPVVEKDPQGIKAGNGFGSFGFITKLRLAFKAYLH